MKRWAVADPFLFCVHHDDRYPAGDERMGPAASLAGRQLGEDFEDKGGWNMYHGAVVPGFPAHPHRGFETVTIVRRGVVDHADSLGAAARYGGGDVQWLTAGRGIVHSEMFPLLARDRDNPMELFQIWLNLPAADKRVEPHFTMLWDRDIPRRTPAPGVEVTVIAGPGAPPPPPRSFAARPENDVAIWTIRLDPGARWTLPPAAPGTNRGLFPVVGDPRVDGDRVEGPGELLLLQGRPIGEPVVAHGPFVMSSRAEIVEAFADFRRTGFGGWPWPSEAPVHARDAGRFARHADGRVEGVS
jgi:redox-sensitive bicupin YhaK (pirin superfamily)